MPVPGRPDAALQFLWHAYRVQHPPAEFDGGRIEAQDLSPEEQRCYDAALQVLTDYFTCEADFGDDGRLFTVEAKERSAEVVKAEEEIARLRKRVAELEAKP